MQRYHLLRISYGGEIVGFIPFDQPLKKSLQLRAQAIVAIEAQLADTPFN